MKKMQAALAALVMVAGIIFLACASPSSGDAGGGGSTVTPPASVTLVGSDWYAYNGDVVPTGNTPAFTYADSGATLLEGDVISVSGGIATMDSSANAAAKPVWKVSNVFAAGSTYPKTFTWIARMKTNDSTNRGFEIEIGDEGGYRLKAILRSETDGRIEFEKIDNSVTGIANIGTTAYHTYHVAVTYTSASTGSVNLYIDGASSPSYTYSGNLRPGTSGANYISIGDNGSNAYHAAVDWIVWTNKAAATPAQALNTLPAGLGDYTGYGSAYVDITPPAGVTSFTGVATKTQINLSWVNPTDGDFAGTTLSCTPAAGSLASSVDLGSSVTSYEVTGLTAGIAYTFSLVTKDATGNVSASPVTAGPYSLSTVASTDATLSGLAISGTTVSGFASGTYSYNTELAYTATNFTVTGTANDVGATLEYALGATPASGDWVALTSGTASSAIAFVGLSETLNVRATAEDGTTQLTYVVNLTRAAPSTVATLSALSLSGITLNETFDSGTYSYTANAAGLTTSTTVSATKTDSTATTTGTGAVALVDGVNTITVTVTAQDGTTVQPYTVVVTKAAATDSTPQVGGTGTGLSLFGTSGTAPSGTISGDTGTALTINAVGGHLNSSNRRFFFAGIPVTGDFIFTARIVSVTNNSGTSTNNQYRMGLMAYEHKDTVAAYIDLGRFMEIGFWNLSATTPTGTRANKLDVGTGSSQSRTDVATLVAGQYLRIQRVGTSITFASSADGITFTTINSATLGNANGNDVLSTWQVGFYAAPNSDVTMVWDNIKLLQP